ncbi:hypothetical protein [Actinomadura madurae]|uniref:hypothetical protein n=1 Tax=Actinomadura madurae TaxID=1993 RepID=UPI002026CA7B|nr:hypothetical protein [Actinomadura madurae]MCP9954889.1 hypothetical protein [Actinomadura madurae]MCP9971631.1 hypothetical protein [Actinomadura madurae]MCP9984123.1 hypothetical protein [Actinomadura madurae]MCQ0004314.1 hypothetical protein [Actinomadura madurae]MCQ0020341.1 hypothetical protein [Actinomadura madurae]
MADNWVETTAGDLRRWADERGETLDDQGVRILLDLAREELELPGPAALTPAGVRELLLEAFPESVVAGREDVPTVLDALRRIVAFLRDTGAVPEADADALGAEIDRTAPEFTEVVAAVDSDERQAAAEVIAGLMQADGVSLDDQEAVDAWVRDFEERPEEERYARTEEYLRQAGELVVPPARLAPEAELADAARRSRLTAAVLALAGWTGERALTEHETLTRDDAAAARAALGLETPRSHGQMEDEGELERLWWAAIEANVITAEQGTARPGPALAKLESGDDAELLAAWLPLFDALAVPGHDYADGLDAVELVQNEMTGVLIHLYEQEEPTGPEGLVEALLGHVEEAYDLTDADAMFALVSDAFHLELSALEGWGIVEPSGKGLALTPLGVWAVRELLVADGFTAPVIGELAGARASELIEGLTWYRPEAADEEIDGWLAAHDPKDAAADLLDVMRTGGPGARNLAAAVLHRIGPEAAGVVRAAREHPLVSPYAAMWLNAAGDPAGRELAREEYLWVFVDTVAGMLETAEPEEAVEAALIDAPPEAEMKVMVDELWRTQHPGAADVLEALGAHHPDKATAKAARTAAYKARSAGQGAHRGV